MTARWFVEMPTPDSVLPKPDAPQYRSGNDYYLCAQVRVSNERKHDRKGAFRVLVVQMDWRFSATPHMQRQVVLDDDSLRRMYTPICLGRYQLEPQDDVFLNMWLQSAFDNCDADVELKFELEHPNHPYPIRIPRQEI